MRKYFTLIFVTIFLYALSTVLHFVLPDDPPAVNWFFVTFFALYSILFTYSMNRVLILKPKAFARRFLALTGIKFLLCIVFLSLVLWLVNEYKVFTALHFLIVFLIYLLLEVVILISQLKKNTVKKPG